MYSILKKTSSSFHLTKLRNWKWKNAACTDLKQLIALLKELNKSNVSDFYQLGGLLQSLKQESDQLVELTLSQNDQDPESETNLQNVEVSANKALSALKRNSSIIATCNTGIHELSHLFRQLYQRGQVLYKFSTYLRVAALNIEAESSRSEIAKEMFLTFSKELRELSDQVGVLANDIYNESNKAGKQQSETANELDNGAHKLKTFFSEAEKNLTHAAADISSFINLSQEAQNDSKNYSDAIRCNINQLTEGIQFEDISRQKIEHIIESLEQINASLKKSKLRKGDKDQTYSLIKIQHAQLKNIQEETLQTKQLLESAVLDAEQSTQAFSKAKRQTNNYKISANSGEEMIDELCDELENIHEIIHKGSELVNFAQDSAAQSVQMTERLSGFAKNFSALSTEMKLKSLNAIIKSIHLGEEGRVLEVLANKVTDISIDSQKQITQIASLTTKAMEETEKLSNSNQENDHDIKTFENTIQSVRRKYQQYKNTDSLLSNSSKSLIQQINAYSEQLSFLDKLSNKIQFAYATLEAIEKNFIEQNPESKIVNPQTEQSKDLYTMSSERAMHEQVLQKSSGNFQQSEPTSGEFESFDLGEFESFEENENKEAKEDSKKLGDNIELF